MIDIDEAQFFDNLNVFFCNAADLDGKNVIITGLDGDYLRYSSNNSFSFQCFSSCYDHHCQLLPLGTIKKEAIFSRGFSLYG